MGRYGVLLQWVLGCLLASVAHGAEWSVAPTLSWTMDHASNRYLTGQPTPGEGAIVTLNALLTHSTPTLDMTVQPMISLQRYTQGSGADAKNRSLNVSTAWQHEQSTLSLLAGYSDLSTLATEIASTGVVGDTHQRQTTAQGSWQLQQSQMRQLNVQLAYADVSYVGQQASQLTGYRYPSLSIGERLTLWPRTSLTVTALGSDLRSPSYGGSNVDKELSVALEHSFSELISTHASIGFSERSFTTGSSHGYVGEFDLTRAGERSQWKLSYQRSVTPNGFGGLVQRDQGMLSVTRDLAPKLTGTLSLFDTRDREIFFFGLFEEGRHYDSAGGGLTWLSGETSSIGLHVGYDRATVTALSPVPPASGWHAGLIYTWIPRRRAVSR